MDRPRAPTSSFGKRICELKATCTRRFCSCVLRLVLVGQQGAFPAGQEDGLDIMGLHRAASGPVLEEAFRGAAL